jgi:hypothetical protein
VAGSGTNRHRAPCSQPLTGRVFQAELGGVSPTAGGGAARDWLGAGTETPRQVEMISTAAPDSRSVKKARHSRAWAQYRIAWCLPECVRSVHCHSADAGSMSPRIQPWPRLRRAPFGMDTQRSASFRRFRGPVRGAGVPYGTHCPAAVSSSALQHFSLRPASRKNPSFQGRKGSLRLIC